MNTHRAAGRADDCAELAQLLSLIPKGEVADAFRDLFAMLVEHAEPKALESAVAAALDATAARH